MGRIKAGQEALEKQRRKVERGFREEQEALQTEVERTRQSYAEAMADRAG